MFDLEMIWTALAREEFFWLLSLVFIIPFLKSAFFLGWVGEFSIRLAIYFRLDKAVYTDFHDVLLPTPDGTTQIDHIVVSRFGLFVIETKNYQGWIFGSAGQAQWTQSIYRRKYKFQNPLRQNYKHVKAVQEATGLDESTIHSLVVFAGSATFKTSLPPNVVKLNGFVPYIRAYGVKQLTDVEVAMAIQKIRQAQIKSGGNKKAHLRNLRSNKVNPRCPRCGEGMVIRTARKGKKPGSKFWGCQAYPGCRGVKPYRW